MNMTVTKDKVVSIEYTLKDESGEILDSSTELGPLEYLHGNGNLIVGLEKALEGKKAGDEVSVTVEPAEAYGEYSDELLIKVPKTHFDADTEIEVGMQFEAGAPDGGRIVTVTEINGDEVTIDANHPLAGEKLFFEVKVISVRDATPDELANGLDQGCGCGGDCGCDDDDGSCGCGGGCGGCH